jgi:CheY-like chemotaxis protein
MEVGSGGAALDLLSREASVDLVMLDFAMPGMNGVDLARQMQSKFPTLPFVFVTGYVDNSALEEIGDARIIKKPFVGDELAIKVQAALNEGGHPSRGKVVPLSRWTRRGQRAPAWGFLHPAIFDFTINLVTAKALGLDVPPTLLARADEVIEWDGLFRRIWVSLRRARTSTSSSWPALRLGREAPPRFVAGDAAAIHRGCLFKIAHSPKPSNANFKTGLMRSRPCFGKAYRGRRRLMAETTINIVDALRGQEAQLRRLLAQKVLISEAPRPQLSEMEAQVAELKRLLNELEKVIQDQLKRGDK